MLLFEFIFIFGLINLIIKRTENSTIPKPRTISTNRLYWTKTLPYFPLPYFPYLLKEIIHLVSLQVITLLLIVENVERNPGPNSISSNIECSICFKTLEPQNITTLSTSCSLIIQLLQVRGKFIYICEACCNSSDHTDLDYPTLRDVSLSVKQHEPPLNLIKSPITLSSISSILSLQIKPPAAKILLPILEKLKDSRYPLSPFYPENIKTKFSQKRNDNKSYKFSTTRLEASSSNAHNTSLLNKHSTGHNHMFVQTSKPKSDLSAANTVSNNKRPQRHFKESELSVIRITRHNRKSYKKYILTALSETNNQNLDNDANVLPSKIFGRSVILPCRVLIIKRHARHNRVRADTWSDTTANATGIL